MDILFTISKNYVKQLCVTIYSIKKNNKGPNRFFLPYVCDEPFSEKERQEIKSIVGLDVVYFFSYPNYAKINYSKNNRWTHHIWDKLVCLYFLPEKTERLLYIDSDIIVDGNIVDYYLQNNKSEVFIGSNEAFYSTDKSAFFKRLNISNNGVYICSGFLLINPVLFLKKIPTFQKLTEIIDMHKSKLDYPEQDFINIVFHDEIIGINSRKYNFFATWNKKGKKEQIIVYHFAGSEKPWSYYSGSYPFYNFAKYWKYGKKIYGRTIYNKILFSFINRKYKYYLSRIITQYKK